MSNTKYRQLALLGCGAIALASSMPAIAQDAAPNAAPEQEARSAGQIEDIVVTARRREEALQSVPVAVTALTGDALRSQNIMTAGDLQTVAPSLSVQSNALISRESAVFNIRGQGSSFAGLLPGVITYFAEVPMDPAGGAATGLYDLSSVQVLRGPQGTLFGRNTNGGAVLLTPTAPDQDVDAFIDMNVGNYNLVDVKAGVTLPVSESLSVRFSGNIVRRDGFTRNLLGKDLDNRDSQLWRVFVRFEPSDSFRNDLIYSGQNSTGNGTGFILTRLVNPNVTALLSAELAAQQRRGPRLVNYNDGPIIGYKAKSHTLIDIATLDVGALTIKNIASYQRVQVCSGQDMDGTAVTYNQTTCFPNALTAGLPTRPETDLHIFTEELQFSGSAFDDRLDWVAGGFYSLSKTPGKLRDLSIYRTGRTGPATNLSGLEQEDSSKALYAQGTLQITDALRLTAGLRHTWDRRKMAFGIRTTTNNGATFTCRNTIFGVPATAGFRDCISAFDGKFGGTTYNVSLDYEATAKTLLYVATRRGYKSGGFNNVTASPISRYNPEFITEYEAGIKTDFDLGDVRGRLNIAVFHDSFKGAQRVVTGLVGGTVYASVVNVEKSSITGVEVEGTLALTPEFKITGNYSYLGEGNARGFIDNGVDVSASRYLGVSKHSGSVTGEYRLPLNDENDGEIVTSATYAFRSSAAFMPNNVTNLAGVAPGYSTVNARLEWRNAMKNVDLALWGRNITDRDFVVGGSASDSLGFTSLIYGEPATYGVQLVYRFDN